MRVAPSGHGAFDMAWSQREPKSSMRQWTLRFAGFLCIVTACSPVVAPQGDVLPFTIQLKEVSWANAPALQSFAVAQDRNGRWLCIGGRTAGLHGQQDDGQVPPPLSNFNGLNDRVWVVDVANSRATSCARWLISNCTWAWRRR